MLAEFTLDRRVEAFHHGIVVAIAPAAHATGDTVCVEHVLVVLARIGDPVAEFGAIGFSSLLILRGWQARIPWLLQIVMLIHLRLRDPVPFRFFDTIGVLNWVVLIDRWRWRRPGP